MKTANEQFELPSQDVIAHVSAVYLDNIFKRGLPHFLPLHERSSV